MGLVLMAGLFAGCVLGSIVTALLGGAGVILAVRIAKTRRHAWWGFAVLFIIVLTLCIVAIHGYPYSMVRPGSDYDVAMKNFFLKGFCYCVSPGPAVLFAALGSWLMPKKIP